MSWRTFMLSPFSTLHLDPDMMRSRPQRRLFHKKGALPVRLSFGEGSLGKVTSFEDVESTGMKDFG